MHAVRLLAAIAFLAGPLSSATPALASPKPPGPNPVEISDEVRDWEATPARIDLSAEGLAEVNAAPTIATPLASCTLGTPKVFLILNDFLGRYQATYFSLVAESETSQIWVQNNLAWPAGDPRSLPVITCEQAQYMLGQFDNTIYPTEIDFFGPPDTLTGGDALLDDLLGLPADYYADPAGRQIVLVENVRDDNYYDPTYPLYIAGFYSGTFETYFDRNVMSIDAYDWANRTGPSAARPFLYEGVFAHEYQHLLHDDYDSDEENFINEGMSDFAEFLVGYHPALAGHIGPAASNPENSLTVWGDQGDLEILTDYGQAYMFQLYLYEQFGKAFTQALFHNPDSGISGVQSTLDARHVARDFAEVFHAWQVALLIDSKKPNGGLYEFQNETFNLNVGTPAAPNPEAYDTPGAPPWGGDFIWIPGDPKALGLLSFNGIDYSTFPTGWTSDGSVLWGGAADLLDNWAIFETTGGGTLTFDTKYDLEETWDFGFVQVSSDGGQTWTSLSNADTRSDYNADAHPKIVANVPGFTGTTGGAWVPESFDLGAYAGQTILVAFREVTDWATVEAGWFIDNVMVDGDLISDGSDASVFMDITEVQPINNDFTVTFVGFKGKGNGRQYNVVTMKLGDVTEAGLIELNKVLKWSDQAVMIVNFDAPEGFTGYADYTYGFTFTNKGPKK
ncbi:MAG TPA: choice-of-anchor J domain-containing protein [Anaerolineales bacterium]|nr:choice-of-anchor J domain-containing protein [Anaerolineales bacterium]